MIHRHSWLRRIEQAWKERPVVWLSGVRRVGKTCLTQMLPQIEYFDCELPRIRRMMDDPQGFWDGLSGKRVVLDEIHRLPDPSELLKIAADHYKDIRVLATGSSTLAATTRFKDTLTGRKRDVWLTPMTLEDLRDAKRTDLPHRLLNGGLPPFFLSDRVPERDFQEWMDAYWAKDIQELFRLERRSSFLRFVELVMAQSGGIFEATRFARPCEVSRVTISNYLQVLEATAVAHIIRPYSTHRATEIVAAPKVYAFDTGFACYYRGWHDLRPEDYGHLWEHFVLNEMMAHLQDREIRYWRDKQGHEVDFIWAPRGRHPLTVECKWSSGDWEAGNLIIFRRHYPKGDNVVVAHDVDRDFTRSYGDIIVRFLSIRSLLDKLAGPH